ncbi:hypothetical protein DFP72DRAFT_824854, partial [Ephemerocybe angulata]
MRVDASGIAIRGKNQSFFLEDHPQYHSQALAMRKEYVVPVLLGPRLPLRKPGEGQSEQWSRYALTLFKPWRAPACLKSREESWSVAYASYASTIPERWKNVLDNMDTLSASREI